MKKIYQWVKTKLNIRFFNIHRASVYFECPYCKYRITETERTYANFDYRCPRCDKSTIFGFYKV